MFKKITFIVVFSIGVLSCSQTSGPEKVEAVSVTIVGSAENPDPVLARVTELEKQGILTNVVVMESFPVQIRLTGPVNVVRELESMPRKAGNLQ